MEENQFYGQFKDQTSKISHDKTWTCQRKRNLKRETESLLIAAQNNTIRTHYIKARIDKTQQNNRCRLRGDRDETIDHIISECGKRVQKDYKTRLNWMGKVIHLEWCKRLKCDHTYKSHMQNQNPSKNMRHRKFSLYFKIQTDHLISTRRPDKFVIKNNNNKKKIKKEYLCRTRKLLETKIWCRNLIKYTIHKENPRRT